jgi:hypothetical protein
MSDPVFKMAGMNTKKGICPVQLEFELEEIACLWSAERRLRNAQKLRRWARQLEVSARIMMERAKPTPPKVSLPRLPRRKAVLN